MNLIEKIKLLTDDEIELIYLLMRERNQPSFQGSESPPELK